MAEDQLNRLDKMTNIDLRAELKRRGCSTSGIKKDLIAKLYAAIQKETENSSLNNSVEHQQNETSVMQAIVTVDDQATVQSSSAAATILNLQQLPTSLSVDDYQSSMHSSKINNSSTAEKKIQRNSRKSSVDVASNGSSNTTSNQQVINHEQNAQDSSSNDNNLEIRSCVSKSSEENQRDVEKLGGESYTPSVGSNSAKLESILKEVPLLDEQRHLKEANSEQQTQNNQSIMIDNELKSATQNVVTNDSNNQNDKIDQSSDLNLSADFEAVTTEKHDSMKEDTLSFVDKPIENATCQSQLQLKNNRCQISSLIKSLHRSTNKINLSSELLKTLISDTCLLPASVVNEELDNLIDEHTDDDNNNEQSTNESALDINISTDFLPVDSMTIGDLADLKQQKHRIVVMNVNIQSLTSNNDSIVGKKENSIPIYTSSNFESKKLIDDKLNITDEPVRIKKPTTLTTSSSQILYIRGLTRPFSLQQLKTLLCRYGTLEEERFWLDKIKSQCLVTYSTSEEAQHACEALDGCRWPSTNPKVLSIRFAQPTELEFSKTHDLPPDQMSIDSFDRIIQDKSNMTHSRRSPNPVNEMKSSTKKDNSNVREWDIPKFQEESCSGFLINEENEPIKPNESPIKGLDDYFRKTKTKPSIYWLALTEEQIVERNRRLEQRNVERDANKTKRDVDENKSRHQKSISPSSKEKRKRSLSSSNGISKRR